ncbi:hypothetical protein B0A52_02386 [Exophiala mesophila]|uniref:Uncharacterized protein n=1 Tax=Exophiala mesophila TaxID=212818 RepID=A0A0D1ZNX1_EXOME|nr:uncharacterized protein PV10_08141 [Exophiala mesophila]KIV88458.1 hypothetical protein PV10_08141 [Exophiala mesophila]RVX73258.1 hypothetical protein B0A52_02386 [Exophiala mesophila]
MGNLCSKSSNPPENFSTPGRPLGTSSQTKKTTTTPVPQKLTTSTPGRSLGGREGASSPDDARSAAARAAEQRAAGANKSGGKLATNLANQKKQTQNQLLNAGSEAERRARDADENAQARTWN